MLYKGVGKVRQRKRRTTVSMVQGQGVEHAGGKVVREWDAFNRGVKMGPV